MAIDGEGYQPVGDGDPGPPPQGGSGLLPLPEIDDGGSAFPVSDYTFDEAAWPSRFKGMTLRDWFAGQALTGMLASLEADADWGNSEMYAVQAIKYADAMLKARVSEKTDAAT